MFAPEGRWRAPTAIAVVGGPAEPIRSECGMMLKMKTETVTHLVMSHDCIGGIPQGTATAACGTVLRPADVWGVSGPMDEMQRAAACGIASNILRRPAGHVDVACPYCASATAERFACASTVHNTIGFCAFGIGGAGRGRGE